MYTTCILPVGSSHTWQPFTLTQQSWTFTAPEKKLLLTPPLSPTEWPTGPALMSLLGTTIKAVHLSQTSIDEQTTTVY
jgi:hypothetical protein